MPGIGEVLALPAPDASSNSQPPQAMEAEATAGSGNSKPQQQVVATHTKDIGIILPPPDIRGIIDKTALFVARNGVEFEKKIMANEQKNAKFNFLQTTDPYHAYYQHKIAEEKAVMSGNAPPPPAAPKPPDAAAKPAAATAAVPASTKDKRFDISQFIKPTKEIVPPLPEQFTLRPPEGLTGQDLEIMKLTAQFVARNGKVFLTGLTSREHNSPQFNFLRPAHSLYSFFTALSDAYFKVLSPSDSMIQDLKKDLTDKSLVLERCLRRLEWEQSQEKARQKAEDDEEHERAVMSSIEWNEAVLVETIDFLEEEDDALPAPVSLEEVMRRSKSLTGDEVPTETVKEVEMEMDEEESHHIEEGIKAAARLQQEANNAKEVVQVIVPVDEDEPPMRIVKNWKRPEERVPVVKDSTKLAISPVTGEHVPFTEIAEHIRISLINPKYKEQKEKMLAKLRETTLATDDEISRNIYGLARLRPDIFGTTEEEVSNAVKAEIEKKKEEPKQVIWDGHSGSINRTAGQAMAQSSDDWDGSVSTKAPKPLPPPAGLAVNIPRPLVQATIQAPPVPPRPAVFNPATMSVAAVPNRPMVYPFVPGMAGMMMQPLPPAFHVMPPLPDDERMPPPPPEEPEPKRQKLDDLIPEQQFALQFPGPITISVALPTVEGEGNLKGQTIQLTSSVSDTIATVKEKLAAEVGIPANKQKLSGRPGFLKDTPTLAHYNLGPGEILSLSLRERGGKKKN